MKGNRKVSFFCANYREFMRKTLRFMVEKVVFSTFDR